jgi:hypothetical protein
MFFYSGEHNEVLPADQMQAKKMEQLAKKLDSLQKIIGSREQKDDTSTATSSSPEPPCDPASADHVYARLEVAELKKKLAELSSEELSSEEMKVDALEKKVDALEMKVDALEKEGDARSLVVEEVLDLASIMSIDKVQFKKTRWINGKEDHNSAEFTIVTEDIYPQLWRSWLGPASVILMEVYVTDDRRITGNKSGNVRNASPYAGGDDQDTVESLVSRARPAVIDRANDLELVSDSYLMHKSQLERGKLNFTVAVHVQYNKLFLEVLAPLFMANLFLLVLIFRDAVSYDLLAAILFVMVFAYKDMRPVGVPNPGVDFVDFLNISSMAEISWVFSIILISLNLLHLILVPVYAKCDARAVNTTFAHPANVDAGSLRTFSKSASTTLAMEDFEGSVLSLRTRSQR